jgi:hypothetical protein
VRPKIFDLLFQDDRTFVLEVCQVKTSRLTSNEPPKNEWTVITRRNVPGYPPFRSDSFSFKKEAIQFYKNTVVSTPRVSPVPTIVEYTSWLIKNNLYDPVLNPVSTEKKDV